MRIAFLGLGKMGSGMAARLVEAGHVKTGLLEPRKERRIPGICHKHQILTLPVSQKGIAEGVRDRIRAAARGTGDGIGPRAKRQEVHVQTVAFVNARCDAHIFREAHKGSGIDLERHIHVLASCGKGRQRECSDRQSAASEAVQNVS